MDKRRGQRRNRVEIESSEGRRGEGKKGEGKMRGEDKLEKKQDQANSQHY